MRMGKNFQPQCNPPTLTSSGMSDWVLSPCCCKEAILAQGSPRELPRFSLPLSPAIVGEIFTLLNYIQYTKNPWR